MSDRNGPKGVPGDDDDLPPLLQSCSLTDFFAIEIQIILVVVSLNTLIVKRYREKPRRSWKIWKLDTVKQAIGAGMVHFINLFLSSWKTLPGEDSKCEWYVVRRLCWRDRAGFHMGGVPVRMRRGRAI